MSANDDRDDNNPTKTFTFNIGVNIRSYFDHTVEAYDLAGAKLTLADDMGENSGLHVFDVTTVVDGQEVKTDLYEDIELQDEVSNTERVERSARKPLRALLTDIITSSDANDSGSLANAIEAAKTFIGSSEREPSS